MKKEDFEKARVLNADIAELEEALRRMYSEDYTFNFAILMTEKNVKNFTPYVGSGAIRYPLPSSLNDKIIPIVKEELRRLKEEFENL